MAHSLVGDVVERHKNSLPSSPQHRSSGVSSETGFPAVQHRSKATSAFKRARLDQRVQNGLNDSREGVSISFTSRIAPSRPRSGEKAKATEDWMGDISRLNTEAVEEMTAEEREKEREDIFDRFGPNIGDLMTKVREARARRAAHQVTAETHVKTQHTGNTASASAPPSPRLRSARKIRFLEPTEADVHVYESEPSSPRHPLALLPPPPENSQERTDISSLGNLTTSSERQRMSKRFLSLPSTRVRDDSESPEEGTPEDIRRRFFPSEEPPKNNPALAWMLPISVSHPESLSISHADPKNLNIPVPTEPRYSLSGARLSPSKISSLPTHLGLHHHASTSASSVDTPAGYTFSDLLLLARSSVPAQRASILGVLAKVLRISREETSGHEHKGLHGPTESSEHGVNFDAMRRDALDAALDALAEKGGVGQRAVDVLWEIVVGFTQAEFDVANLNDLPCVDFTPRLSSSSPPSDLKAQPVSTPPSPSASLLVGLPLARILPALTTHLTTSSYSFSLTYYQVLDVLFVLSHFAQHARTIVDLDVGTGIIAAMLRPHLKWSSGPDVEQEDMTPMAASIRVMQILARSARDVAVTLTGPADVLLRYIMTPLPAVDPAQRRSDGSFPFSLTLNLVEETLRLYTLLAQYGLYAQVATTARDHFAHIEAWLLTTLRIIIDPALTSLIRTYLGFLEALIVCATDPHHTTPSHDILWSQVQGWAWADWIFEIADVVAASGSSISLEISASSSIRVSSSYDFQGLWANICHTAAAWVEGASMNGIKGGKEERMLALTRFRPYFERGRSAELTVSAALATLGASHSPSYLAVGTAESLHSSVDAASLVAATMRLALACFDADAEEHTLELPGQEIHEMSMQFLKLDAAQGPLELVLEKWFPATVPEHTHVLTRPICSLLVYELLLKKRLITPPAARRMTILDEDWLVQALRVLHVLLPGDESYAARIFEILCNSLDSNLIHEILSFTGSAEEHRDKDGMKILLPFLIHSLRTKVFTGEGSNHESQLVYLAPMSPTPESVSQCTTLLLPSLSRLRGAWESYDKSIVLPLKGDWPTWPLNHLLRSGSSSVFHELPAGWNGSETDVARASLLLALIVQKLGCKGKPHTATLFGMSRAEAIFICMKVFMLEHGQQQLDTGEEVFRDSLVMRWMEELLTQFMYTSTCKPHSNHPVLKDGSSLEHVSKAFLGTETPFYQFYTDFLALYDAISFSNPLFGRLLLPPVSMSYAPDYRKLLFGDFGHVLRTIETGVEDVLCEDVREYLWPVEDDAQMIGCYLKALITSNARGFIRWMALHHVALNIWPECRDEEAGYLQRAGKLLSAVLRQGNFDIVRDVALYRQTVDEVWTPPRCYEQGDKAWRERRLHWVERMDNQGAKEQLRGLLLT